MPISIGTDQRVAFVGKTGSGKTHAAGLLALGIERLIVLDPKGTLGDPYRARSGGYSWHLDDLDTQAGKSAQRALERGEPGRLRIPAPTSGDWEPWLEWAYKQAPITVYVDELYGILNGGSRPSKWLTALYTRGRELGIGTWAATQRPAWVPRFCFSESEWIFLFRLTDEEDRARMAQIIGPRALTPLRKRAFWLAHEEWDAPLYYGQIATQETS